MKNNPTLKNRGALSNPCGRFEPTISEEYFDGWDLEEEVLPPLETILYPENAKTIISRNDSPDISFEQSINPYRGCEHGCIYCYARPSHSYVNLSPGIDFETKIFYKVDADKLLEQEFNKKNYQCKPILVGANTDPYQPSEAKLKITRSLLEIFAKYNHPVIIITKNALIQRDSDILSLLAEKNLVRVAISITSLSNELKKILEPRTSTPAARLRTIEKFSNLNIPVRAMLAPIIPMINDMEIEKILAAVSVAGAKFASYVLIRLPHEVKDLFKECLATHFPQRKDHVMSIIRQTRGGKEYDSTFGKRMSGEGQFADLISTRFSLACRKYKINTIPSLSLDLTQFRKQDPYGQLSLW